MKLTRIVCIAALAVLTALASRPAQANTSYSNGDFFLGVRSQDTANDYLIDLGQGFNFKTSFSISIAGLTTDLNSIVGTGWATNPDVFFAVFGGTTAGSTTEEVYATNPNGKSDPWQTATHEGAIGNSINTIAADYANNPSNVPSGLNPQALEQGDSDASSYASQVGNGDSLGYFNPTIETEPSNSLDFEYVPAGSAGNATDLGTFTLNGSTNSLNFTTASVPEPSTVAAFLVGAAALIAVRRRRA